MSNACAEVLYLPSTATSIFIEIVIEIDSAVEPRWHIAFHDSTQDNPSVSDPTSSYADRIYLPDSVIAKREGVTKFASDKLVFLRKTFRRDRAKGQGTDTKQVINSDGLGMSRTCDASDKQRFDYLMGSRSASRTVSLISVMMPSKEKKQSAVEETEGRGEKDILRKGGME
ncbi:hypothetical protein RRG08_002152 [Elysia crispata]|uniref:Uncharacterized protein n=1 Tax=Elysia crispata TaxID=231223 RepID=A0AAE0ZBL3_9GAST|nr:hypothetical protein RRG08_002152 [Elysia crispata]